MSATEPMAPPRWARRKQARPAELLRAALELFVERGYAGTRLGDVAARAGVSKAPLYLLYLDFDDKEDRFKAVVRESVAARLAEAAADAADDEGATADLLRELMLGWWRDCSAAPVGGIGKLSRAESGGFPQIAGFFLQEIIEPWYALLAQAVERGIARREFRRVDMRTFVRVLGAPLVMLALWPRSFGAASRAPLEPERDLAAAVDATLAALRSPPARRATKRANGDANRKRRRKAG